MPRKKLTPPQAQNLLEQYHLSGLTRNEFCQKHDISLSFFGYWLPKLQNLQATKQPSFQELRVQPIDHTPCKITLVSGVTLEFPSSQLTIALAILTDWKA